MKILLIISLALLVSGKPGTSCAFCDDDGDGILNKYDDDDDNDGILDKFDRYDDTNWDVSDDDEDDGGTDDDNYGGVWVPVQGAGIGIIIANVVIFLVLILVIFGMIFCLCRVGICS